MNEKQEYRNCKGCTGFSGMICYLKGNPCYMLYCGEVKGTGPVKENKKA